MLNSNDIAAETIDAERARKRTSSNTSDASTVSSSRNLRPAKELHLVAFLVQGDSPVIIN